MSQSFNPTALEGSSWESFETPKKSVDIGQKDSGYKSEQRMAGSTAAAVSQRPVPIPTRQVRVGTGDHRDILQRHIHNIAVMVILSSVCFGLFIGNMSKEEGFMK